MAASDDAPDIGAYTLPGNRYGALNQDYVVRFMLVLLLEERFSFVSGLSLQAGPKQRRPSSEFNNQLATGGVARWQHQRSRRMRRRMRRQRK
jgi:hypothetical protein